ncbi:ATP-dependent helicase [Deinococcus sp. SDU3-2]|uniref:DNA 3'-5' helicase n=1 Tax=Deinococcus terrestris TaxID=2651870 RepID=A0A7X1NXQ1_9DEIO|nr:3'-5' exonuclease [Deinococcus terrestris]MPY67732.1 ATP-dependent helicase [Deinococcus terrestris]
MSRLLLAQSFTRRLGQFPNQEQKLIRDAVMVLHLDVIGGSLPRPGLRWHGLNSPDLYSISPNMDLRVILYHKGQDYVVLYADHHDGAYAWANRRRLEVHPYTGAMQVVEVQERTEVLTHVEAATEERVFYPYDAPYLLQLGVPERYVQTVRHATSTNAHELLELLPEEVAERLLGLLAGELVVPPDAQQGDPFSHPDARRAFVVADNEAELGAALQGAWQDWIVFLHPSQRALVDRTFGGAARVTGGAGTGKTVVALHRAARLARAGQRVLLTTYSRTLGSHLSERLVQLVPEPEVRDRITVRTVHALAAQLAGELGLPERQPEDSPAQLRARLERAAREAGSALSPEFLLAEWRGVIEAQGLRNWEAYREARRTGRGTPLGVRQRWDVWQVTQRFRQGLEADGRFTWRTMCDAVTEALSGRPARFDHVIADEAQDLGPSELRFLLTLTGGGTDHLLLAMDEGQRIYQRAFPMKSLGLSFQGRSARLRLNYRTSRQIRELADRLLPGTLRDADDAVEQRLTLSRFQGPEPEIAGLTTPEEEFERVGQWLNARLQEGLQPEEIAVFTRHDPATTAARLQALTGHVTTVVGSLEGSGDPGKISVSTMHRAKGLEFRAVAAIGMHDQALPSAQRLAELLDPGDQADFLAQERHLLYVAATRARDHLLLTYAGEPSRFLTPLVVFSRDKS